MPTFVLIRLEAPMMSFSAPMIDNFGATADFPAASQMTGLLANALGYDFSEHERTQRLQERLRYAARLDRPGVLKHDFQTAMIGAKDQAYTSRGRVHGRAGGDSFDGAVLRNRPYLADASCLVAAGLAPGQSGEVSVEDLASALRNPARPLFIGRKAFLPSAPLFAGLTEAATPLDALRAAPFPDPDKPLTAMWDVEDAGDEIDFFAEDVVSDRRNWLDQIHVGKRTIRQGLLYPLSLDSTMKGA